MVVGILRKILRQLVFKAKDLFVHRIHHKESQYFQTIDKAIEV